MGQTVAAFVRQVAAVRRRLPILHRARFLTAEWNEELEVKDVTWLKPDGTEMDQAAWDDANTRCMGILLDGRAQTSGIRRRGQDATVLVVLNSYHDGVPFTLPAVPGGLAWRCSIDTNQDGRPDGTRFEFDAEYVATGRSLLLFELILDRAYLEARREKPAIVAS